MRQILLLLVLICFGNLSSAQICESLFGNSDLYRSIRALAALRLELDLAQTSNDDSITISLLRTKYEQKKKAILNYVLKTETMTNEHFKKLIKFEIEVLQKEGKKIDQARIQQNRDINELVVGSRVTTFNSFKFEESNPDHLEITATPITRATWHGLLKLRNKTMEPLDEALGLLPITEISYNEVKDWISQLNYLSEKGDKNLENIFIGHKPGDHYRLPSRTEWYILLVSAKAPAGEDLENWRSRNYEEVTTRKPFNIQGKDFYGLAGLAHFVGQSILLQFYKSWISPGPSEITLMPQAIEIEPGDKNRHNLTFNLIRQRKTP